VAGSAITAAEVGHWEKVLSASEGRRSGSAEQAAALGFLLQGAWTRGEARELGVVVSEVDAKRRLAQYRYEVLEGLKPTAPVVADPYRQLLTSQVVGGGDCVAAMRNALLAEGLRTAWRAEAERRVTLGQIQRYYVRHRASFVVPERRDIEIIETKTLAAARAARRAIESGRSFRKVAREVSVDPAAPRGLRLGVLQSEGVRSLADAIFAARPGVLVGPRVVTFYYLFEVLRVHPARSVVLGQAEGEIRLQLASEVAARVLGPISARRWEARTRCMAGSMGGLCKRIVPAGWPAGASPVR
jgi:foldase protein PrsA